MLRPMLPAIVLVLAACGSAAPPAETPRPTRAAQARTRSDEGPKPVTSLTRSQVKRTISEGLGMFLQNVSLEDWPVMHEGKFYGFKIRSINADWGVDLRPGDVVTKVNGIVPEHPDEADADAAHPAAGPPLPHPGCLTLSRARYGVKSIGSRSGVWPRQLRQCRERSEWSSGPPRRA